MRPVKDVEEAAAGVLPYVVYGLFRNVARGKAVEVLVEKSTKRVFVPAAASLLATRGLKVKYEVDLEKNKIDVKEVDGYAYAYLPGKTVDIAFYSSRVWGGEPIELAFEGETPRDFDVSTAVARVIRYRAGAALGGNLLAKLRREGWSFSIIKRVYVYRLELRERNIVTEIEIPVKPVNAEWGNYHVEGLSVTGAVINMLIESKLEPVEPKAREKALETLTRAADIAGRLAEYAVLHSTSKTTFRYVIGEVDGVEGYLAGRMLYRGVVATVWADNGTAYLNVSVAPYQPPAAIVLSYPPFNWAVLASLIRWRPRELHRLVKEAEERARRKGGDARFILGELRPLGVASVHPKDVREALRHGYPRLSDLHKIMDGLDKVPDLYNVVKPALPDLMATTIKIIEETRAVARARSAEAELA